MKVAIIGTGYVGLVSGTCFSDFGVDVVCVDKIEEKITKLNSGIMPIYEIGLKELVSKNVDENRLSFTTDIKTALKGADAVFIGVGTPPHPEHGHADLKYVYAAAKEIAENMDGYTVVVTKSTVPVGTGDEVEKIIKETNPNADFDVVSNPEFLREGNAIGDFMNPDRIVIGTDSVRAKAVMAELYKTLEDKGAPVVYTTRKSSELIKYAANAFLAVKITYINEIANLCEKVGAKVDDVAKGIGMDNRIGPKFLQAGPGYGGSCFPKDTLALSKTAKDCGAPINIVETTIKVNEERKYIMLDKIINACDGEVKGKNIGVLGLAFKQNTDDMRDAISLSIIPELEKRGAKITSYDPQAMEEAKHLLGDKTQYVNNPYSAVDKADMAIILTEWDEFRNLEMEKLRNSMNGNIVVDLRNLLDSEKVSEAGLKYHSIGREEV